MATSYEIGYSHGNRAGGTNNHKPGALNLEQYNAGFQAGERIPRCHISAARSRRMALISRRPRAARVLPLSDMASHPKRGRPSGASNPDAYTKRHQIPILSRS